MPITTHLAMVTMQENLDDPPPHVHSQVCLDSCPVQDIYTETSFSRFSKGARTNLYGLVVVKELGQATTPTTTHAAKNSSGLAPFDLPSQTTTTTDGLGVTQGANTLRNKTSIFTETGDLAYRHLPGRYVLVAAGGAVKFFLGLQDMLEFTLGPSEASVPQGTEVEGGSGEGGVATALLPNLEIVSLDAFERKDERGCQLVLVVSIAKAEDPAQFELRFYGVNTFAPSIRELLLQLPSTTDIQTVPLTWAPTKIIHAPLEDDPFEMVVLVGGSDSRVHVFVQDAPTTTSSTSLESVPSDNLFKEQPVETLFSVLASFPYCEYCVLSLVIKDYPTCRVIAAGTQNGTLNVGIIPRHPATFQLDRENAKAHTVVLFSPITTLTVYTSRVQTERRRRQQSQHAKQAGLEDQDAALADAGQDDEEVEEEEDGIHLLVTCAIEQAWVYSDINNHGLSRRADLAECSYHDSILAAHAMDADWDGQNEVLIGTYGRQLMVFKQLPPGQEPYPKSSSSVNQQKQPQQSQQHHQNHQQYHSQQQQQRYSGNGGSSSQQLQRQLRNSIQIQQQLQLQQLQQLQQQQLIQQQQQQLQQLHLSGPTVSSPSAIGDGAGRNGVNGMTSLSLQQWGMTWNRRFASPVYGISSADLNDDGLEELVITTINGVSFFLPDSRTAKRRLAQAVERMREIKEMREILAQLRRDNRKLVDDRRVREEKERVEEEEERERKEVKEAEEEAERKEKGRREQEMEELERREKEEKAIEKQRLLDPHQRQRQEEQSELEKETSLEPKHEQLETEESIKDAGAEADVIDDGEELASVEVEGKVQKDDASSIRGDVGTESKNNDTEVGDEKGGETTESAVVVVPENEGKEDRSENEESLSEEQAVVGSDSLEQDSLQESPEQAPDVDNFVDVGVAEEPNVTEVRSSHSDHDNEPEDGVSSPSKQAK
ncbi:hypothetical protein BGW39_003700 [Mortierella sp. 14UC]|nr:hypothetical protein BGW39_003700 [Mortierella sp. 14UC]